MLKFAANLEKQLSPTGTNRPAVTCDVKINDTGLTGFGDDLCSISQKGELQAPSGPQ